MSAGYRIANRFIVADPERDLLGRGGMGDVYRATDTHTGETVAVKALNPDVLLRDPGLLERFLREGEALRRLNHPNIVRMVGACEEDGRHYLIMEYVGGGSLDALLQQEGRFRPEQMVRIGLEVADALARAHHLGILHRDLKPANVLLAADGTPRLADFGIAHLQGSPALTQTGVLVGTVDYLSPEACQGEPLDERSDIWSFGVLLFEMLTGSLPFPGTSLTAKITAILTKPAPDLAQLAPDIPGALADLVSRMLVKDPQGRVTSARQVGAELEALHKGRMPVRAPSQAVTSAPLGAPTPSVALRPAASPTEQASRPAFVAREHELSTLESFLQAALACQGRVAFVVGEAGQGKTALLQEFARRAQAACPDLVVASGDCDPYTGIGDPYLPFREILAVLTGDVESRLAAQAMGTDQARRLRYLMPAVVQGLLEGSADLVDVFVPGAELLRRAQSAASWPDCDAWIGRLTTLVERKASLPGDPNLQQAALFEQYTRLLTRLADERPLLLLLDDLQWADGGSCSLLFHLSKRIAGSRIMILGAYRPSEVALGRAGERHPLETVFNELRRLYGDNPLDLGLAEGRAFVDAFLDSEPNHLDEEFRQSLYASSQGQPLATVELLRDLQERGGLVRDSAGRWTARPGLEWSALPARVEAMIAERIARLDEQQRRVLQVASVEGETFTAEVVGRVVGIAEGNVVRLLSEALDRAHRLVKAEGVRHLHEQRLSIYRFRHILFQKYLYTTLDAVERSHLHDAVASTLQALHGEQAEDVAAELARHFGAAGATDQAADFLKRAGDRAGALVAPGEAAQYYLAARDAYTKAYGEGWNPLEQVALERKIGEALFRHGDYQEAAEHLQRALSLLDIRLPESRAQVQRVLLGQIVRQAAHRLLPRLSTRPALGTVPGPIQQEMDISYLISFIDFFSSRQERFLLLAFRMLNVSESNGYVPWIARSCAGLTMVFDFLSLRRLAQSYSTRAVSLAEQVQDPAALAQAHHAAAHHAWLAGQWDNALEHGERSLAALGEAGALRERSTAAWVVASALLCQGDARRALAVGEGLVRIGDEKADLAACCVGAGRAGLALVRLGRLEDAHRALERAVELADAVPDDLNRVEARGDLGKCLLRQGKREAALAVLEEARRLVGGHHVQPHNAAPVWAGLVEAYVQAAEHTAGSERSQWLQKASQASVAALKNARRSRPALAEAMRVRGTYEGLRGNAKSAQKWWQRSAGLAAQMGMRYDLAISLLEMGKRLHERADLEQAKVILLEIDAEWDLARTKEALKELGTGERQEPNTL